MLTAMLFHTDVLNITGIIDHITGVLIYGWRFRLYDPNLQDFENVYAIFLLCFASNFAIAYCAHMCVR